ncbi:MAG: aminotransferase class V-fold PLP-dependent enzyme [Candidatus Krumholzibacteriota bacterium]|nr:aminotransferase class V-fold PLP-dependent enzyme [Candidatus Krumholzibacteriota bacterium]
MKEDFKQWSFNRKQWLEYGKRQMEERARKIEVVRKKKFDTIATHGLYDADTSHTYNSASIIEPIYMSTAQAYYNSAEMEAALAYEIPTWCYTRIANPSNYFLEETMALLETYQTDLEASCVITASGMAAIRAATEPFLQKDDSLPPPNFVASAKVYGGTFQQFSLRRGVEQGIEVRWIKNPLDLNEWKSKVDEGTRFLYGEFPSNPQVSIFDIAEVATLAHQNGVPLIVDATCASPALTRPLQFGADIVVQSATKVICSSGFSIAGTLTARKNIASKVGSEEMKSDFAMWVKLWPYRDNGPALSPMNAILALNDLRYLRMRMAHMSRSALTVAKYLEDHPKVSAAHYPGLVSYEGHAVANKYMTLADTDENMYGFMLAFEVAEKTPDSSVNARKFYDALDMIWRATDLGRVKTVATLNAISTHSQQGEEGRDLADIKPSTCRLALGIEDVADVIADLDQAFKKI